MHPGARYSFPSRILSNFRFLSVLVLVALAVTSCQRRPGGGGGGNDDLGFEPPSSGGGTTLPPSSGGGGSGLTDADKQALANALRQNQTVEPQDNNAGLSEALAAEAKRLMEEERKGRDVAVQKMALAGKMLQECAKRVVGLAPLPGQPLLGSWNGAGACAVKFEVEGNGKGGKYQVTGGTKGDLQADQKGNGAIKAAPFSGNVKDNPRSGEGRLTHPTFFKNKDGATAPCNSVVKLATPKSPIPKNYQEAMRQTGKCFRQTLILMSPIFDKMFRGMDPALAALLQQRFLGISGGSGPPKP